MLLHLLIVALAQARLNPSVLSPEVAYAAPIAVNSTTSIADYVRYVQHENGLPNSFYDTLKCESQDWQNIQSEIKNKNGPNGREDSWGIAQIYLPAHPNITRSEALNPLWAIPWAAGKFKSDPTQWTCYRKKLWKRYK